MMYPIVWLSRISIELTDVGKIYILMTIVVPYTTRKTSFLLFLFTFWLLNLNFTSFSGRWPRSINGCQLGNLTDFRRIRAHQLHVEGPCCGTRDHCRSIVWSYVRFSSILVRLHFSDNDIKQSWAYETSRRTGGRGSGSLCRNGKDMTRAKWRRVEKWKELNNGNKSCKKAHENTSLGSVLSNNKSFFHIKLASSRA